MVNAELQAELRAEALRLGFVACGFASAAPDPQRAARLEHYLGEGRHGAMDWMDARKQQRASPQGLWPEANSVIALGMSYAPDVDPLAFADAAEKARVSVYAQGRDYHDVVKKALKALARWLIAREPTSELKVFVDTAPVMEKPLGEASGIGWQGKHTNLVSRSHGSWLFLGAIYSTLEFAPDLSHPDRCGNCRACQDACPTDAIQFGDLADRKSNVRKAYDNPRRYALLDELNVIPRTSYLARVRNVNPALIKTDDRNAIRGHNEKHTLPK